MQASAATNVEAEDSTHLQRCNEASAKVKEADAHVEKLVGKCKATEERMDALKQDLACLVRALSCANQEAQEAKAAFVAASACLNAGNPITEAMSAAPAAHRNYEASPFQQEMANALITHFGLSTDIQKQYQQHAEDRKREGLSPLNVVDWVMYALRARENRAAPAQAQAPQQSEAATVPLAPPPAT